MVFKCTKCSSSEGTLLNLESWRIEYLNNCMTKGIIQNDCGISSIYNGFYIGYKDIDLADFIAIDFRASS